MTNQTSPPQGENDEAIERFVRSFDEGPNVMIELLDDDVVAEDWMTPGKPFAGKEQLINEFFVPIMRAFPDVHFEMTDVIRGGDRVVVCGDFTGTFTDQYLGIPSHNERVRWAARDIYEFSGSKIVRILFANDTLTVARQLRALVDDAVPW